MIERNKYIVRLLQSGKYDQTQVGEMYGITHQAISLIFKKETGYSYAQFKTEKIKHDYLFDKKYDCASCGESVNRINMLFGRKYCKLCSYLFRVKGVVPWIENTCEYCHDKYHPKRRYLKGDIISRFCSLNCWYTYKSLPIGR